MHKESKPCLGIKMLKKKVNINIVSFHLFRFCLHGSPHFLCNVSRLKIKCFKTCKLEYLSISSLGQIFQKLLKCSCVINVFKFVFLVSYRKCVFKEVKVRIVTWGPYKELSNHNSLWDKTVTPDCLI